MYRLITFLDNFLRGENYFGDFIKTLIIGFLFYVVGFIFIILKILIFTSVSNTQSIAILYYVILFDIIFSVTVKQTPSIETLSPILTSLKIFSKTDIDIPKPKPVLSI